MSFPTITELGQDVAAGLRSVDGAALWAQRRREAGLCDECATMLDLPTHDYERGHLCAECRLCHECMLPKKHCVCEKVEA